MKNFDIKAILLADSTIIGQDGKLSILGIFDRITAPSLPSVHQHFELVLIVEGSMGDHVEKASIISPSGRRILESQSLNFKILDTRAQIINKFLNIELTEYGKYSIDVFMDDSLEPIKKMEFSVAPLQN